MTAKPNLTVVGDTDASDANGDVVIRFHSRYVNDRHKAGRKLDEQFAEMLMTNIRELWDSGAWRRYRHALGTFEWREHEFDYFLAAQMMAPRDVADHVRNGSIPDWAELINCTNPGRGKRRGKTRRPLDEVADQIRHSIPGGYGDADRWIQAAGHGFGDRTDQQVAKSPTKVKQAVKAGNITAVKRPPTVRVDVQCYRDQSKSEDQQRAELILRYLATRPTTAAIVKKELS